jgi:hypothetical protein
MSGVALENYEGLDAGAHVGERGSMGTITLLTRAGPVSISMKRAVMEQLYHCLGRELSEHPLPSTDGDREIS